MLRIVAAVIAVIGVVAAFTGVMYLRYSGDSIRPLVHSRPGSDVVVAARDIPAGTVIEADMVAVDRVADAKLAPSAYRDTAEVVGKVPAYEIASGDQVVSSKVVSMPPWGTGISQLVPPGRRVVPPGQSIGVGFGN
jgi:Flp pilus assembly protein CpaB